MDAAQIAVTAAGVALVVAVLAFFFRSKSKSPPGR
jgi:LPXTG-motif cell wall-anchored protein